MSNLAEFNEQRKHRLDNIFKAFSIVGADTYVYVCDIQADMSRWSRTAVDYFDLPDEYMFNAGSIWEKHVHPEDRQYFHENIESLFKGENEGHDMQYRALSRYGHYVTCTCRGVVLRNEAGEPIYFCGSIYNHGEQRTYDSLTGLGNQYGFFAEVNVCLHAKQAVNLMVLGICKFSNVNNLYGYTFGNRVLQRMGRLIQMGIGRRGTVFRLDGSRFAIITKDIPTERLKRFYSRFAQKVRSHFTVDNVRVTLALAAGLLELKTFSGDDQTIFSCLNFAFNDSKEHRQGELVVFKNSAGTEQSNYFEKINVIRNSISNDCENFYLCYQPIVNTDDEQVCAAEALIRWRNDKYGDVRPDEFIPVLERDNLFPVLGTWILRRAMTDAVRIVKLNPEFEVNVNVSYSQFEKADFITVVQRLLQETGLPPQNLCLEITERCRLLDIEMLCRITTELSKLGVKFALDDFGTGFSSLSILKHLKLHVIKLDKDFVKNIEHDPIERFTVKTVKSLAGIFNAIVCVEGVENQQMRDILLESKVQHLQGYHYSKPLPFEHFFARYFS